MRDLEKDLQQLKEDQNKFDLGDEYLAENKQSTRKEYQENLAHEWSYGVTFVESTVAEEWLTRALEAEKKLEEAKK